MILYKEYIPWKDQEIKMFITFNKESTNWATSQPKKVGYQVTVIPVKRTKHVSSNFVVEESSCFSGFNDCLLEIDRQSKKRLATAIKILQERKEIYLKHFNE